jgi:Glycosyl transferase family 2
MPTTLQFRLPGHKGEAMTTDFLIFLPVRNGGRYVREAVDSIVAQTDPNWRLVVLENGSTDNTVATLRSYADPRIEIVAADEPLDIIANWQRIGTWLERNGINDALVTMTGHDDRFDPQFIATVRSLVAAEPDATLYQTGFDFIDAEGRLIQPCRPVPRAEVWTDLAAALCWGIRDSYSAGYAFRAGDYLRVGGIPAFPQLLYADHLLFIRLTRLGHKSATNRSLCSYRLHESASNSFSPGAINAYVEALDCFVATLTEEMAIFAGTDQGRDALACLLGRQMRNFDRPGIDRLLTTDNRARLDRLRNLFGSVARHVSPDAWAGDTGHRWVRSFGRLIDAAPRGEALTSARSERSEAKATSCAKVAR